MLMTSGAAYGTTIVYNVSVTTGFPAALGSIEFQYNPGPVAPVLASTVTISAFTPLTGLGVAPSISGGVSGSLNTTLTINNSTPFNDYFNTYTLPTTVTFTVTFSGPGVDTPGGNSGSTFAFFLYQDPAGMIPVGTSNVDGILFRMDLSTVGAVSVTNFASSPTSVTFQTAPEPATIALFPAALGALALMRRRRA